jgi:electron transfer flavoprotein alpha subunit
MTVLVLVERHPEGADEISLQALTLARTVAAGEPVHALIVDAPGDRSSQGDGSGDGSVDIETVLGEHGVSTLHIAEHGAFGAYAPVAVAQAAVELIARLSPTAVVAAGSERGNEVLAHVAAKTDLPLAANCVEAEAGDPMRVTRVRWGGSLLEEADVHGAPALLTVAPHAVAAQASPTTATVESFTPALSDSDLLVRVSERADATTGGISLAEAKVVVSCGRGAGSPEGFGIIEELAGLLGAAVGCSRAVTMAGWRPHTDQVGQTGTKISPDIYIACGISGATQHMAGCKGAKVILAINTDPAAPILASAEYAVIADLHEVVPALSAEIRKARGV